MTPYNRKKKLSLNSLLKGLQEPFFLILLLACFPITIVVNKIEINIFIKSSLVFISSSVGLQFLLLLQ